MKLIECYIENFGKLSNFKHSFATGLNTVKKDNGYGKTTLTVFIKAMLYGLDKTKRVKLGENDRKHYLPWNGGRCGGALTISVGDKKYRIERTFMPKAADDTFALYDLKSGKPSEDYTDNIGEEIFGIDEDGFERTVFLSEANLSGKNDNKTVSGKLSGLVGYDGDLGEMDEAIDLIDKERKQYSKRGGGGELGEIKARIAELKRNLSELEKKKDEYAAEERNLLNTAKELDTALKQKKQIELAAKEADKSRQKRLFVKQYKEIEESVLKDEESLRELEIFFKNGVPTQEKIEEAKELSAEARRIYTSAKAEDNSEFTLLCEFFKDCDEPSEFERIKETLQKIGVERSSLQFTEKEAALYTPEEKKLPTTDEVDKHTTLLSNLKTNKKANNSCLIPLLCGVACLLLGILLGFAVAPILYAVSAVGVLLSVLGIINLTKAKKLDTGKLTIASARDFLACYGIYPSADTELLKELYILRAKAAEYEEKLAKANALSIKCAELKQSITEKENEVRSFIARFKIFGYESMFDAVNEIFRKRDLYTAYIEAAKFSNKKREESLVLAKNYSLRAESFLALYPTVTSRPFDELSAKLLEFTTLSRTLLKTKESLRRFAEEHGITEKDIECQDFQVSETVTEDPELDAKIRLLEQRKTLIERTLREITIELDRWDELTEKLAELTDLSAEYENRVSILQLTKKHLEEAKDTLTSKYLSRTKGAFDKYVNLIANESGENFQMDTSFSIMKNEMGSLKSQDAYSLGTRELYALSTRFALIESLYENEQPFVILDDPFAHFDDKTLGGALSALEVLAEDRQIIYFTCSSARS